MSKVIVILACDRPSSVTSCQGKSVASVPNIYRVPIGCDVGSSVDYCKISLLLLISIQWTDSLVIIFQLIKSAV